MATKKKLLQAAAGTAAASGGAGALNVEDVFSTYLYEGNGGVQAVGNGINLGQNNDGSSVYFKGTNSSYIQCASSSEFNLGTGDYTIECWFLQSSSPPVSVHVLFDSRSSNGNSDGISIEVDSAGSLKLYTNSLQFSGGSATTTDWNHYAITRSNGDVYGFINGTQVFTGANSQNHTSTVAKIGANIPLNNYTKGYISNLRLVKGSALYTSGFTPSTSPLEAVSNTSLLCLQGDSPLSDNSGNSISLTNNNVSPNEYFGPFDAADAGEGGLVWTKSRSSVDGNIWIDTERGVNNYISSNSTAGQNNLTLVSSFNSNGHTVSGNSTAVNSNGYDYASWTFRKAPKFFDVVTWTGDGNSGRQISHNLGSAPAVIIIKSVNFANNWFYNTNFGASSYDLLYLDLTNAASSQNYTTGAIQSAPTDSTFTLKNSSSVNGSGNTYVAYLFAHNDGDGTFGPTGDQDIIKCGSFTGNGSSTGPEIDLGFEPQWILLKDATNGNTNWNMHDNMRGISVGGADAILYANQNFAENASTARMDITSTGFKMTTSTTGWNASSANMIYIAIRRGPMAVPTDATDVFDIDLSSSTTATLLSGFSSDAALAKDRAGGGASGYGSDLFSRLTGDFTKLNTTTTDAETSNSSTISFEQDGIKLNGGTVYSSGFAYYQWKRAPNFCDVVAYTGNGTAGRTVSHNLGVAPEMMWVKHRASAVNWNVYHKDLDATNPAHKYLLLDSTDGVADNVNRWNDTEPTDSVFSVGTSGGTNVSGGTYIAYLFASLDGVSKCGSFSHTSGSNTDVDCGFSNGARFVLIKRTDNIGHWITLDTERGIVTGNDAWLNLNLTSAENTSYDLIDPLSSGFTVDGSGLIGTGDYIFYAIA